MGAAPEILDYYRLWNSTTDHVRLRESGQVAVLNIFKRLISGLVWSSAKSLWYPLFIGGHVRRSVRARSFKSQLHSNVSTNLSRYFIYLLLTLTNPSEKNSSLERSRKSFHSKRTSSSCSWMRPSPRRWRQNRIPSLLLYRHSPNGHSRGSSFFSGSWSDSRFGRMNIPFWGIPLELLTRRDNSWLQRGSSIRQGVLPTCVRWIYHTIHFLNRAVSLIALYTSSPNNVLYELLQKVQNASEW